MINSYSHIKGIRKVKKPTVSNLVIMGDSLSDRGTLDRRLLFGFIPLDKLSGLEGRSPVGRFTNGYAWSDHLSAMFANEFTLRQLKKRKHFVDVTDMSDAIITDEHKIKEHVDHAYSLSNDLSIHYQNRNFIRSYDEGGLTAHDYSWTLSNSISRFFTRLIVSTLAAKRRDLLAYYHQYKVAQKRKAETLIIEWSGANDLITVNARPSKEEVDKAIRNRIENAKMLIQNGYRHVVLFNLPDLSLTPRYQRKNLAEQANAKEWSNYFNAQLAIACEKLADENKDLGCSINVFDINAEFKKIYEHPAEYGFKEDKLKQPYLQSPDFKIKKDGTSPATGYLFWDDVHPTADTHVKLAEKFFDWCKNQYNVLMPESNNKNYRQQFRKIENCEQQVVM